MKQAELSENKESGAGYKIEDGAVSAGQALQAEGRDLTCAEFIKLVVDSFTQRQPPKLSRKKSRLLGHHDADDCERRTIIDPTDD